MPQVSQEDAGTWPWIELPYNRIQRSWREESGVPLQEVLDALRKPGALCTAAVFSLARIGDATNIPAVDAVAHADFRGVAGPMRGMDWSRTPLQARAVVAQLRAVASGAARDRQELGDQMRALVTGIGMTPEEVDGELAPRNYWPVEHTVALYVAAQIADMALMAANRGIQDPAGVSPVSLQLAQYPPVAVKAQYSAYGAEERTERLVEHLASAPILRGGLESCEIPLLIGEGPLARVRVLAKLAAMNQARDAYPPTGFQALLQVLPCVAGPADAEAARALVDHPHFRVQEVAQLAYNHMMGTRYRFMMHPY